MVHWEEVQKKVWDVLMYPVFPRASSRIKNSVRALTCAALCASVVGLYQWKVKGYDPRFVKDVQPIQWAVKNAGDFSRMNYQEAIEYVQTPLQAKQYLNWLCDRPKIVFDKGKYFSSFRKTHEGRTPIDCSEMAYAAAALLSDNGYPPLLLAFFPYQFSKASGHVVFAYKEQGKFGSVGIEPDDFQHPVHDNLESLVQYITESHANPLKPQERYRYYCLFNLEENDPDYIATERNLFRLFLRDVLTPIPEK